MLISIEIAVHLLVFSSFVLIRVSDSLQLFLCNIC